MTRVQEWLSSNKNRAYPFVEDSDLGVLPTWTLLDIQVVDAAPDLTGDGVLCNGFDVLPEAAVLHFSKGAAAFDIRVVRGSGMLLGVIDVSATLKVKYAVFGGGREYAFPDEGAYAISAKILPSKTVRFPLTQNPPLSQPSLMPFLVSAPLALLVLRSSLLVASRVSSGCSHQFFFLASSPFSRPSSLWPPVRRSSIFSS